MTSQGSIRILQTECNIFLSDDDRASTLSVPIKRGYNQGRKLKASRKKIATNRPWYRDYWRYHRQYLTRTRRPWSSEPSRIIKLEWNANAGTYISQWQSEKAGFNKNMFRFKMMGVNKYLRPCRACFPSFMNRFPFLFLDSDSKNKLYGLRRFPMFLDW